MCLTVLVHWCLKCGLWVLDYCRTKQLVSKLPRLAQNMVCFKTIVENLLGRCVLKCYKYSHVPRDGISTSSGSWKETFPLDAVNPDSEIEASSSACILWMENEQAGSTAYKSSHFIPSGLGRHRAKEMGEGSGKKRWHRAKEMGKAGK